MVPSTSAAPKMRAKIVRRASTDTREEGSDDTDQTNDVDDKQRTNQTQEAKEEEDAHTNSVGVAPTAASVSASSASATASTAPRATRTITPPPAAEHGSTVDVAQPTPLASPRVMDSGASKVSRPVKVGIAATPSSARKSLAPTSTSAASAAASHTRLAAPTTRPTSATAATAATSAVTPLKKRPSMAPTPSATTPLPSARRSMAPGIVAAAPPAPAAVKKIVPKPRATSSVLPPSSAALVPAASPSAAVALAATPSPASSTSSTSSSRLPSTAASAAAAAARRANLAAHASSATSSLITSKLSKLKLSRLGNSGASTPAVASADHTPVSTAPPSKINSPTSATTTFSNAALWSAPPPARHVLHATRVIDEDPSDSSGQTSVDTSAAPSPHTTPRKTSLASSPVISPLPIDRALAAATTPTPVPAVASVAPAAVSLLQAQVAMLQQQLAALSLGQAQLQQQQQVAAAAAAAAASAPAVEAPAPQPAAPVAPIETAEERDLKQQRLVELVSQSVHASVMSALTPLLAASAASVHGGVMSEVVSLLADRFASEKTSWMTEQHDATLELFKEYEAATQKELAEKDQQRQDKYETDTVRILANVQSVQTQAHAATAAIAAHDTKLEQMDQLAEQLSQTNSQLRDLTSESHHHQHTLDALGTKVATLDAQAVLRAADIKTLHAVTTDHALLLAEHKKTQMHTVRVTQEHTDRIVEWEELMQAQAVKTKAHDEWIKQNKDKLTPTHTRDVSVELTPAVGAPVPVVPFVTAPTPSVAAFEELRRDHRELKASYQEKVVQLDQIRAIMMKLIVRDTSAAGLDMLASLMQPTSTSATPTIPPMTPFVAPSPIPSPGLPPATPVAAAPHSSTGDVLDIDARWAAKKAERAAKSAAKHAELSSGVAQLTPIAPMVLATPPRMHSRQASLEVPIMSPPVASPTHTPRASNSSLPLVTLPAPALNIPNATPTASPLSSPHPPPSRSVFSPTSSSSIAISHMSSSTPAASSRRGVGVWVTPAKPRPGRAAESGVTWMIHFNSSRTPLRPPPTRVQIQLGLTTDTPVHRTAASRVSLTPVTVGHTEDLPAASSRRKSHLRSHAQGNRPPAEEEFVRATVTSDK